MSRYNVHEIANEWKGVHGRGSFVTITAGYDKPASVTNNFFVGPATTDHITIGKSGAVVKDLFAMSLSSPKFHEVRALLVPPCALWRRALIAVARWMLRRAA